MQRELKIVEIPASLQSKEYIEKKNETSVVQEDYWRLGRFREIKFPRCLKSMRVSKRGMSIQQTCFMGWGEEGIWIRFEICQNTRN